MYKYILNIYIYKSHNTPLLCIDLICIYEPSTGYGSYQRSTQY